MADDKKLEIEDAETPAKSGLNPDDFSQRSQVGQRPTVPREAWTRPRFLFVERVRYGRRL